MAILENREEYGCTCHYMVDDFDAGDLLKVRRFPMDPGLETAQSLEKKAQKEMLRLFSEFCELAESGDLLPREPQDPQRMRYLDHETFESLKQIPAGADAATVDRIARAFWAPPYPGAWVEWDGQRVEVVPARGREAAGDAFGQDALSNLYGAVGLEKP
jgi:methionyl-tRNA formyltransferase